LKTDLKRKLPQVPLRYPPNVQRKTPSASPIPGLLRCRCGGIADIHGERIISCSSRASSTNLDHRIQLILMPQTLLPQLACSTRQLHQWRRCRYLRICFWIISRVLADVALHFICLSWNPCCQSMYPQSNNDAVITTAADASRWKLRLHDQLATTRWTKCNRELHRGVEPRTFSLRMRCSKPTELMKRGPSYINGGLEL
jgi:hypothetical protein